jgi:hypothetical protein
MGEPVVRHPAQWSGEPTGMSGRDLVAAVALAVFVVATTVGGFLVSVPVGLWCLGGTAAAVALLLGWQPGA